MGVTNKWRGDAIAVAQVVTITVTADDATTTYKLAINGKVVSVLGSGTGVNNTATALQAALAASTIAEFQEVTWTVNAAVITGTAVTAGVPFTATSSVSGGAGTIGAVTTTTTSSGPNDWSVAANWTNGTVPANTDDVFVENSNVSIKYGLAQSGVTLNSLQIASSFTGEVGLPVISESGGYYEYRSLYLAIGATTIRIGEGAGSGSARIKIDTGSVQTTLSVSNTATPKESGLKSVLWKGTHASNTVLIIKGSIGIATFAVELATVATLTIGYVSNQTGDSDVFCSPNCTLTTINKSGGTLLTQSSFTTLTQTGGDTTVERAATATTCNIYSGNLYYKSTGTLTTLTVDAGVADFTRDMRGRTVTNTTLNSSASLKDPFKTVTFTNPVSVPLGLASLGGLDLGVAINLQRS